MKAFRYALRGLRWAFQSQRNMRIHLCFAFYVLLGALVAGLEPWAWCAALLSIALVMGMECINSALEALCDTVHPERHPGIARAKDAAAGGVLLCAVLAAAVGCILFFRPAPLSAAAAFARRWPLLAALIVLSVLPALWWVFHRRAVPEKKDR